jgi:hypothetical protein
LTFMVQCIMIIFTKMTNKMQLCWIVYYSLTALHVSSNIIAHHQEHLNCNYRFWFYSRVSSGTVMTATDPFIVLDNVTG